MSTPKLTPAVGSLTIQNKNNLVATASIILNEAVEVTGWKLLKSGDNYYIKPPQHMNNAKQYRDTVRILRTYAEEDIKRVIFLAAIEQSIISGQKAVELAERFR